MTERKVPQFGWYDFNKPTSGDYTVFGSQYRDAVYSGAPEDNPFPNFGFPYGYRVRYDFGLRTTSVDYGKVRVDVSVPTDLVPGTEVVILRSGWYYPEPPNPGGTSAPPSVWSFVVPDDKPVLSPTAVPPDPSFVMYADGEDAVEVDLSPTYMAVKGNIGIIGKNGVRVSPRHPAMLGRFRLTVVRENGLDVVRAGTENDSEDCITNADSTDFSFIFMIPPEYLRGDATTFTLRIEDVLGVYPTQFWSQDGQEPSTFDCAAGVVETIKADLKLPTVLSSFYDYVTEGTVSHYRVYVREPMFSAWDLRGQAHAVAAARYGGEAAAVASVPNTFLTNGSVYGIPDESSPTYSVLRTLGLWYDDLSTVGDAISGTGPNLLPTMVEPMLRSLGMPEEELRYYSSAQAPFPSSRLKSLLYRYRRYISSKGTAYALCGPGPDADFHDGDFRGYLETVTGSYVDIRRIDAQITYENLLLTVQDSCPDLPVEIGEWQPPGPVPDTSLEVIGNRWRTVSPSVPVIAQNSSDPWWADPTDYPLLSSPYQQHTHRVWNLRSGATLRSRTQPESPVVDNLKDYPKHDCCIPVSSGTGYWFRLRARATGASADVTVKLVWRTTDGTKAETATIAPTTVGSSWTEVSASTSCPFGYDLMSWSVHVSADAEIGAIQASHWDPGQEVEVGGTDVQPYLPYRDPRSVLIYFSLGADGLPSIEELRVLAKLDLVVKEWLPIPVNYRVVTSLAEWEATEKPTVVLEPSMDSSLLEVEGANIPSTTMDNPAYDPQP